MTGCQTGQGCPLSIGGFMIASSVTGVSGPGDSQGKYKPKNSCSCSCACGDQTETQQKSSKKNGCFKNYKFCGSSSYKSSAGILKIKTC